ncbi:MAG TPA: GrpB family protein [Streptosporangiaceae bacterium]
MTHYPPEITQRFHGTSEQTAAALVGEPPAKWQSIVIEDYDPAWAGQFAAVSARLRQALGDQVISVEHVGSTSVPGLAAKPIIDIDLSIEDTAPQPADYSLAKNEVIDTIYARIFSAPAG